MAGTHVAPPPRYEHKHTLKSLPSHYPRALSSFMRRIFFPLLLTSSLSLSICKLSLSTTWFHVAPFVPIAHSAYGASIPGHTITSVLRPASDTNLMALRFEVLLLLPHCIVFFFLVLFEYLSAYR